MKITPIDKQGLEYIAAPYTPKFTDSEQKVLENYTPEEITELKQNIMADRVEYVTAAAAYLMSHGVNVFSPLTHCHPMAIAFKMPTDWTFWQNYDRAFISHCKRLWILKLPGYDTSTGVNAEKQIAESLDIPVSYLDPLQVLHWVNKNKKT